LASYLPQDFGQTGIPSMRTRTRLLGLTFAVLMWHSSAQAGLGGDAQSVPVDRVAMHGQVQSISLQQYDQHTITTDAGTIVNEYATRQGRIFAVTWQGPMPPNLQQLFGTYYEQYQSATAASAQAHPGTHRQLSVAQSDFVVQAFGRMRYYHGKAYVPSLVPAGVLVAGLQ
jgi:hypothetical protein